MPAVNFIYKPPWPVLSLRQALYQRSIHPSYIATRDADTTYKASSKAKGKHVSQQHLMQSLCKKKKKKERKKKHLPQQHQATTLCKVLRWIKMSHYIPWLWKCRFLLRATLQKLPTASSAQYLPLLQQTVRLWGRDDSLVVSLTIGCDTHKPRRWFPVWDCKEGSPNKTDRCPGECQRNTQTVNLMT